MNACTLGYVHPSVHPYGTVMQTSTTRKSTSFWQVHQGSPGGSDNKESALNAGDLGLIPGSGRCPRQVNGYPLGMVTHSSILPGEFHGQRSLADYCPWGCKESDTTNTFTFYYFFCRCSPRSSGLSGLSR